MRERDAAARMSLRIVCRARSLVATRNFPRGTISTIRDVAVAGAVPRSGLTHMRPTCAGRRRRHRSEGDAFEVAADEQRALPVGARIKKGGDSRGSRAFAVTDTERIDHCGRDTRWSISFRKWIRKLQFMFSHQVWSFQVDSWKESNVIG